jgi:hypothetical protein
VRLLSAPGSGRFLSRSLLRPRLSSRRSPAPGVCDRHSPDRRKRRDKKRANSHSAPLASREHRLAAMHRLAVQPVKTLRRAILVLGVAVWDATSATRWFSVSCVHLLDPEPFIWVHSPVWASHVASPLGPGDCV